MVCAVEGPACTPARPAGALGAATTISARPFSKHPSLLLPRRQRPDSRADHPAHSPPHSSSAGWQRRRRGRAAGQAPGTNIAGALPARWAGRPPPGPRLRHTRSLRHLSCTRVEPAPGLGRGVTWHKPARAGAAPGESLVLPRPAAAAPRPRAARRGASGRHARRRRDRGGGRAQGRGPGPASGRLRPANRRCPAALLPSSAPPRLRAFTSGPGPAATPAPRRPGPLVAAGTGRWRAGAGRGGGGAAPWRGWRGVV